MNKAIQDNGSVPPNENHLDASYLMIKYLTIKNSVWHYILGIINKQ